MPLLETQFGKWDKGVAAGRMRRSTAPALPAARQVYIVDKPGAPQSQVRIGWVGVARSTPDYFPITVMNTVLGGAFSSRLNLNLREKHGYTYGAQSQFDMRLGAGPFVAAAGIQTDKTADALKEFFERTERHPAAGARRRADARETLRLAALSRSASKRPATSRRGSSRRSSITCRTTTSRRTCRRSKA